MPSRPHLLIFNPDQWRGDVMGHLGNPAASTPNLDRLAETEAVSFRYAFCQNPVCTPSRCSFMTGWYPHVRGHRTMFHMLRRDEPMLLRRLREEGYFVWWGGKNDLVPAQQGYGEFCDLRYRPTGVPRRARAAGRPDAWRGAPGSDTYYSFYIGRLESDPTLGHHPDADWAVVEGAVNFIRNAPADRPLCIFLALACPHPPYAVEEPWYGMIDRAKIPPRTPTPEGWKGKPSILAGIHRRQNLRGWSEERWRELRATYYGMCARVDHQLDMVLEALREAGIYDDTAIFFFSDHGDFTGDYGLVEKTQNTFEDCLVRVPLVIKPPRGVETRPGVREALVELVDVPATVEDLLGMEPRHTHFGVSLLPLLADPEKSHRDAVFCEGGRLRSEKHCMELESTENQEPAGLYWPRLGLQHRIPEHTKAVMMRTRRYKYVRRLYERDELYDLERDPGELRNLIDEPAMAGTLARLKERMLDFFLETADVVPHDADRRG